MPRLPTNPVDGQTIEFLVGGIAWRLRYRAARANYKWEWVG
jgi:hypothetical protein